MFLVFFWRCCMLPYKVFRLGISVISDLPPVFSFLRRLCISLGLNHNIYLFINRRKCLFFFHLGLVIFIIYFPWFLSAFVARLYEILKTSDPWSSSPHRNHSNSATAWPTDYPQRQSCASITIALSALNSSWACHEWVWRPFSVFGGTASEHSKVPRISFPWKTPKLKFLSIMMDCFRRVTCTPRLFRRHFDFLAAKCLPRSLC